MYLQRKSVIEIDFDESDIRRALAQMVINYYPSLDLDLSGACIIFHNKVEGDDELFAKLSLYKSEEGENG